MLKITTRVTAGVVVFELAGKLSGLWVKELKCYWRSTAATQGISAARVDLSAVTFIDQEGKNLLREMYREEVDLVATGCLNKCIVEGIMRSGSPKEKKT
jgi:anti-anti-sigma regulatory factor